MDWATGRVLAISKSFELFNSLIFYEISFISIFRSVNERYTAICEIAKNYSILSLGISCFQIKKYSKENEISILNKTYDILTLRSDKFMVDTESLSFLSKHGFDFNLNASKGIKYLKANDKVDNDSKESFDYMRQLFVEISFAKVPIIVHNGLIDLIFLYENFYSNCPNTLMKFVADLSEIFSSGILDTKYIVDFHARYSASYLEYLFLKTLVYFRYYFQFKKLLNFKVL